MNKPTADNRDIQVTSLHKHTHVFKNVKFCLGNRHRFSVLIYLLPSYNWLLPSGVINNNINTFKPLIYINVNVTNRETFCSPFGLFIYVWSCLILYILVKATHFLFVLYNGPFLSLYTGIQHLHVHRKMEFFQ